MAKLCFGCMQQKENSPICELCGFDERMENQPHQLPIGTILQNQYLVGRVLGQGGFGITYIGWDQHLSIPVAIKEYYPGGVVQRNTRWSTDVMCANGEAPELFEKHKTRFLKEARTLAQLSGIPEIVQIKSFFPENGTAYIVMEYVEGITLKDHLKRLGRPMTEGEALTIMEPVLKALQKVHDHGLIHRDISPDNIMLPKSGGVKLIDFGTVRYMDDSGKSKSTEAVLKPGFAPMEQYNTRGNLGTWTDVYAICATYHYLLTGKVPADVHDRMDEGESLNILRARSGISKKLIATLEKGMKLRIQERIQTTAELYQLLYGGKKKPAVPKQQEIKKSVPEKKTKKKGKGSLLAACTAAAVAVSAAAMLLIPKEQKTEPSVFVPETTAAVTQSTDALETTIPETAAPETAEPITPESMAYAEAEQLLAEGETARAAIAFGKLAGYKDARERSFALWDQIAQRDTFSVGENNIICIQEDDIVVTYGVDQIHNATEWKNLIAVSAAPNQNVMGLKADGTVLAASMRDTGQDLVSDWEDIVAISSGWTHNVGLRMDGTVVAAGENVDFDGDYRGQCDVSHWKDIVSVCAGHCFTVGLKADGTVVTAGATTWKLWQCEMWTDIIAIAAGESHILGLKSDGTVLSVGSNTYGECKVSDWKDITAISAGAYHSVGLKNDSTVVAVGTGGENLRKVFGWTDIAAIDAGYFITLGIRSDGTLVNASNIGHLLDLWNPVKLPQPRQLLRAN